MASRVTKISVVSKLNQLADVVCSCIAASEQLQTTAFIVQEVAKDHLKDSKADILLIDPDMLAEFLPQVPKECKWVQSTWAGVELVMNRLNQDQRVPSWTFTRYAGPFGPLMTQYVLTQVLARERFVVRYHEDQAAKRWRPGGLPAHRYRSLADLTLCILGVGEIGRVVASTLLGLGSSVRGVVRSIPHDGVKGLCYFTTDDMAEAMHHSDYIINLMPSTPLTRGIINRDLLTRAHCAEATFINAGRGDIVENDSDWCDFLDQGLLKHAILDVFRTEPLPEASPLWTHPSVTITPHVAATSFPEDVAGAFVRNLERYATDPSTVTPQVSFPDMY
ncbi:hypothetical protein PTSG_01628 [Salpingoeca rosetta]|uniref:D-isomer specific 2-hydroxyacid dehydrogenase NAD-binding domain-containing protein n=1 Tax=Salpingoeca rosetta (strain ATCC 50818 / BSB-021) TaxID=946362 RepID=F2TYH6_SALR5|nr:uncharacterized protein PTSG_01628 [Salpingoeca rosetta]EGD78650.1 hypothetical protein PTSG_01628 [Salpingoeca rosetta]|eukprot:XP_004997608.1 hypothetical protein PTSG_01628 [Salpingoeca rosetta]